MAMHRLDRVVAAGITKQLRTALGNQRLVRVEIVNIGGQFIGHISILAPEIGQNVVK
jgi:hypothetical protein